MQLHTLNAYGNLYSTFLTATFLYKFTFVHVFIFYIYIYIRVLYRFLAYPDHNVYLRLYCYKSLVSYRTMRSKMRTCPYFRSITATLALSVASQCISTKTLRLLALNKFLGWYELFSKHY